MAQIDKTIEQVELELHARANVYFQLSQEFWKKSFPYTSTDTILAYATLLANCDVLRIMEAK